MAVRTFGAGTRGWAAWVWAWVSSCWIEERHSGTSSRGQSVRLPNALRLRPGRRRHPIQGKLFTDIAEFRTLALRTFRLLHVPLMSGQRYSLGLWGVTGSAGDFVPGVGAVGGAVELSAVDGGEIADLAGDEAGPEAVSHDQVGDRPDGAGGVTTVEGGLDAGAVAVVDDGAGGGVVDREQGAVGGSGGLQSRPAPVCSGLPGG